MTGSITRAFDFLSPPSNFQNLYLTPFWQRRMVELSALCRVVELECPNLSSDCGLNIAYRNLQATGPLAAKVLRSPELLQWINVSRYFVLRNIHQSLPVGHVRDHFGDLRRFAFAAACAEGRSSDGSAVVQQDGRISLPGLGLTLSLGRQNA